jgi:hypothetical protein
LRNPYGTGTGIIRQDNQRKNGKDAKHGKNFKITVKIDVRVRTGYAFLFPKNLTPYNRRFLDFNNPKLPSRINQNLMIFGDQVPVHFLCRFSILRIIAGTVPVNKFHFLIRKIKKTAQILKFFQPH